MPNIPFRTSGGIVCCGGEAGCICGTRSTAVLEDSRDITVPFSDTIEGTPWEKRTRSSCVVMPADIARCAY